MNTPNNSDALPPMAGSRLPELRARFPKIRGIKYEPDQSCRECHGSGVSPAKTLKSGTRIGDGPCACVFLGEHTREIKTALAGVARKALGEHREFTADELRTDCKTPGCKSPSRCTNPYHGGENTPLADPQDSAQRPVLDD